MAGFTTAREALYGKGAEVSSSVTPNANTDELLATLDLENPDQITLDKTLDLENPLADFFFFPEEEQEVFPNKETILPNKETILPNKEILVEENNLVSKSSVAESSSFIAETLDSTRANADLIDPSAIVDDIPEVSLTDYDFDSSDFSSPSTSIIANSVAVENLESSESSEPSVAEAIT